MQVMIVLSVGVSIITILSACFILRRVKKQIMEMTEALHDVKEGNGNRRILSAANELVAPLAYEMNEIIVSYENRLSKVRQAEETNRQLMTSLSHDVRTPLTTLIGYLDAAHKGIVIGNILIDWIPVFEDKQIEYNIDIPEQPFRVKLDMDSYMRILNNLIQNVLAHSQADRIGITMQKQNETVQILLVDNGIGIGKEDLKHIFERLYKCDKGRSEKGSGLGLSIVYQLVEKMNGKITVESEEGKGTVFTVTFPLI